MTMSPAIVKANTNGRRRRTGNPLPQGQDDDRRQDPRHASDADDRVCEPGQGRAKFAVRAASGSGIRASSQSTATQPIDILEER